MTILKTVSFSDCFSYGSHNQIHLDQHRVSQIIGKNGVGKSSIPLILQQIMWSKNSKNIKKTDIPNRYINQGYKIQLDFQHRGEQYTLVVDRRKTLKVDLYKNGQCISAHTSTGTYKIFNQLIGLQFKTGSQLIYQHTNTSLQFLTATDSVRKKFLIQLFNFQKYSQLYQLFKSAIRQQQKSLQSIKGKVSFATQWLNKNDLSKIQLKNNFLPIPQQPLEKFQQISLIKSQMSSIQKDNNQVKNNEFLKQKLQKMHIPQPVQKIEGAQQISSKLGQVKGQLLGPKAYIQKISKLQDKCPTCQQPITKDFKQQLLRQHKQKVASLQNLINQSQKQLLNIKTNNQLYNNYVSKKRQMQALQQKINYQLNSQLKSIQSMNNQVSNINAEIEKIKSIISQNTKYNMQLQKHNARVSMIQQQSYKMKGIIQQYSQQVSNISDRLQGLQVLRKSFSPSGLIAYKIQNAIQDLQQQTNKYLSQLSQGRFTLQFIAVNDKLNVQITDHGKQINILALSSGQLARVNIATLLGIRKLMTSISKAKLNVLFLDQVISVLDDQGKQKLVQMLLKQTQLNIFLVSHGWQHPLVNKIQVEKHNQISQLVQYG